MASSLSDPSRKRGREEDDEESPHRKEAKEQAKEEKAKEEHAKKDAAVQLFVDNRWSVGILLEAFMKLRDVAAAFNMPRPAEPKERTVKALAFKIHGLAEDLEKLPFMRDAGGSGGGSDGSDGDGSSDDGSSDDSGTPTAPPPMTAPLS